MGSRQTGVRWLLPSLGSLLGLVALVNALVFRSGRLFVGDGDVGRHVRVGRTILASGSIPRTDLFSHTREGAAFVPYEWLSEAMTALADAWLGLPGVALLTALLFTAAVLGVYRIADELGGPRLLSFAVALLALLLQSVHLLPRPHLFTTALAAMFMVSLVRFTRSARPWELAPLPLLMLVWSNAHGGFLIGFILITGFLAGAWMRSKEFKAPRRAMRPLAVTLVLCGAASLLNPAGPGLWAHTTGYLGIDFLVDATHEYQSVNFHESYGKLFFVALFAGPALWMTGRVRVTWLAGGFYLLFAAAALHSARNIPLFTVVALPWLAVWAQQALAEGGDRASKALRRMTDMESIDRRLRPGLSSLLALGLLWWAAGPGAEAYRWDPRMFPVETMRAMAQDVPAGHVFNQMSWGGYLLYERDDVPVFIDGQTDFYGPEVATEYLTVLKGHPGWDGVLEKYGVRWTLTQRREPINQLLALDPRWEMRSSDDVATVYRRVGR